MKDAMMTKAMLVIWEVYIMTVESVRVLESIDNLSLKRWKVESVKGMMILR